jgi:hypothetical protein
MMATKPKAPGSKVQGEGDYESARHYRSKLKTFIATHDVEKVARAAAPRSAAEARSMKRAEAAGKARSKAKSKVAPKRAKAR